MMFISGPLLFFAILAPVRIRAVNAASEQSPLKRPNFVMIMTDDQDLHLNSLDYQPAVQKHFAAEGTFFRKHFCTIALCCPSRVSLWTGMAGHNTNVTDVSLPYGGYPKFVSQGFNDHYLPVWLQAAGYNTYYTGKFLNAHTLKNYNNPFPNGWNGSDFLLDPRTYIYYNTTMQRNKEPPKAYPGNYSTDLISAKAIGFLDEAAAANAPFFLGVMPIGPHSETVLIAGEEGKFNPPVPADRHKDLYHGVKVPRTANFNPEQVSGGSWVKQLPRQNDTVVAYNDEYYRLRLASLAAVDDLINSIFDKLEAHGLLDNTYVLYTADNGYHIGQHRLSPGKTCAYEEDINVPMFIRGPGVPSGETVDLPTSHTDIVPTLFQLAGLPLLEQFDGAPMPITETDRANARTEHVNVEFWGSAIGEGAYPAMPTSSVNNTYKALRVVAKNYDISYIVWCTNEHELYDMKEDPGQLNNAWQSSATIAGYSVDKLQPRLDALLMVLKTCKGQVCVKPWATLHPKGNVASLADAMDSRYDGFYASQPKVSFEECALGQIRELEGPQNAVPLSDDYAYLAGAHWSEWT